MAMMTTEMFRIVALFDASQPSRMALRAAIGLASQRQAALQALFVEDERLLRSAAYPFSRELDAFSGQVRALDQQLMESALRQQAERVDIYLQQALQDSKIEHSLHVARGQVISEALASARADDLLVIGRTSTSAAFSAGMGSTCRAMINQAPCAVLVWNEARRIRPGPALLLGDAADLMPDRQSWPVRSLLDWLHDQALLSDVRQLPDTEIYRLPDVLRQQSGGVLILPRHLLRELSVAALAVMDQVDIPILVIP